MLGNKKWLDNHNFIFNSFLFLDRPWEAGEAGGVSTIILPSGQKKDLLVPDDLNQYALESSDDTGNFIYYSKSTVKNKADWEDINKTSITFWKMNDY